MVSLNIKKKNFAPPKSTAKYCLAHFVFKTVDVFKKCLSRIFFYTFKIFIVISKLLFKCKSREIKLAFPSPRLQYNVIIIYLFFLHSFKYLLPHSFFSYIPTRPHTTVYYAFIYIFFSRRSTYCQNVNRRIRIVTFRCVFGIMYLKNRRIPVVRSTTAIE